MIREAFLLASGVYAASRVVGSRRLLRASKPLVVPLLLDTVLTSRRASATEKAVAAVGLTGGWVGDVVLLEEGRLRAGAAAFAVNQAAYHWLLWRAGARFRPGPVARRSVPLAAAAWFGRSRLGLVATYGGMVTATSALAADPAVAGRGLAAGGNLFLLSDSLILAHTLLPREDTAVSRGLEAAVAVTYVLAQRLLVDGLFPDGR